MSEEIQTSWKFVDGDGRFLMRHPEHTSYLYFPLASEGGMKSSISPELRGDAKVDQNTFLLVPASVEDLHNSSFGRNFWVFTDKGAVWSVSGCSALQRAAGNSAEADEVSLQAGFLWHTVTRRNKRLGLKADVTNFTPVGYKHTEFMRVVITNVGEQTQTLTPTAAVPLFCRSADSVRDHRHVTSLLHRIRTTSRGIIVHPTLSFDERGHRRNRVSYAIFGAAADGSGPIGYFPVMHDYVGEGGSLDWPRAITANLPPQAGPGEQFQGYEAMGAMRFAPIILAPGESTEYLLVMGVEECASLERLESYLTSEAFGKELSSTQQYWESRLSRLHINTGNRDFDLWFKWVTLQPMLRRIYGCSFLPYHDYGRGGRGWRDLWQDCLSLLIMEPDGVRQLIHNNFAGVRLDGSNATIIGDGPGEFIADRNHIARVWMDHGAWPWLTTKQYIDYTGDCGFLFEQQTYFRDSHTRRCRGIDTQWNPQSDTLQLTRDGEPYQGTVLEHLLVQHLTAFFNVGENNNILLEGADWNDGLDMATNRGESVAFTSLYGHNLVEMSEVLEEIHGSQQMHSTMLGDECVALLDTLGGKIDYDSVDAKKELLDRYIESTAFAIGGGKREVPLLAIAEDLRRKGLWILEHVRNHEWIQGSEGYAWFNGYYDDDGKPFEGDTPSGVRMTLAGQVFAIMSGAATSEQLGEIVRSVNRYLWDESVGGCRLNTDFGDIPSNMGRCYGFAYGHKENGAMFCHMAVMYAYALFSRGLHCEGRRVLDAIYGQCMDFPTSRMYPGIPEYFDARGRGMYPYLTGSASWFLLVMLTQVFGVRGSMGDLVVAPRISAKDFNENGEASIETYFAERRIRVRYCKTNGSSGDACSVRRITRSGSEIPWRERSGAAYVPRDVITAFAPQDVHELCVELA